MISVQQAQQLINDPSLSEEEVAVIRDEMRLLAEIIYEHWQEQKALTNQNDNRKTKTTI